MITLPVGAILVVIIFIVSMGVDSLAIYFNVHSLILVGGGTVAVLLFSAPTHLLKNLWFEIKELLQPSLRFENVQNDLLQLSKNRFHEKASDDELIAYAQELWQQGTAHELFIVLVSQKRKEIEQRSVDSIQCLKNLAKYPPALGMAGTVMGIVTLFESLESNKDGIGPAMAMALTATFFGLAIANGAVMPLADRLHVRHMSLQHYLSNVYQVILLINQEEATQFIEDEVRARAI
jgi:chemotaxis protein MotA